jgi:hypothetical protein
MSTHWGGLAKFEQRVVCDSFQGELSLTWSRAPLRASVPCERAVSDDRPNG